MKDTIGLLELSSIAKGVEVTDSMLKSASVEVLSSKTICPGKYIVMITGDVAAVKQAVEHGEMIAGHLKVDSIILPKIDSSILPAISGVTPVETRGSVGVVETFSVAACIEAVDAAMKAANVTLVRVHMAFGIGGKCYFVVNGDIGDVNNAVNVGCKSAGEKGLLVHSMVVAKPHPDMWQHLI
ncbi:BMC domain-containing protein [Vibrio litoralis]|uniref:BMC domain-containing protein n=1 Tax=Vibrio litoralis TaxID=335972 RepID=UPI000411DAB4|nr:BMC domain-containing protein [Vibrio litoralis]